MNMTDNEILSSYSQAKDQKEQIKILADLNCTSVWEMREHLVSLGAQIDGRWFQNLNPKRVGMAEKGGKNKGAAADPDARLKDLKTALADKEKEIGELQARLARQDETLEAPRRAQLVKQCELEEQSKRIRESKEAEQKYQVTIAELESKIFALETNADEPAEKELSLLSTYFVDSFAGGGGASTGIERATGHPIDIAINHDQSAILMHKRNHPYTKHYREDVFAVDPVEACGGHPVRLAWFSPDCKHFSRAKGAALVDRKIRGLAWIVLRWAALVRPEVIALENVPEFVTWGPVRKGKPVKKKAGQTFDRWYRQLSDLGYKIEYRELCAADYGTPTIRTRFCLIARCDGQPIVWPERTHAPRNSEEVRSGKLLPWRSAAEIINWTVPGYSIFESKAEIKRKFGAKVVRPLADNTMRRIAAGVDKFVIRSAEPFIVECNHTGPGHIRDVNDPHGTVTARCTSGVADAVITPFHRHNHENATGTGMREPVNTITSTGSQELIAPYLTQYHGAQGKSDVRGQDLREPIMTVDASNRYARAVPVLTQYFSTGQAHSVEDPLNTVTTKDRENLAVAHIQKYFTGIDGADARKPLPTVTAVDHNSLCVSHLAHFKGKDKGQDPREPLMTITQSDGQFAEIRTRVVTYAPGASLGYWPQVRDMLNAYCDYHIADDELLLILIHGAWYFISDITLRMLTPRELYNAMGFPPDYIIDVDPYGNPISRADQVARCGNAVCPPVAEALVRANLPECPARRFGTMKELYEVV